MEATVILARNWSLAVLLAGTCSLALAAAVPVASYDMPNGDGQASGGSFNYWDKSYSGLGATSVDSAPLSGGTGDLTDGITTSLNWNLVENIAGTGPYVGWRSTRTPNPVVRFNFAGSAVLGSVTVHMDDANGFGGVATPLSIDTSTDGVSFTTHALTDPAGASPFAVTLPLNVTAGSLWVRFVNRDQWIFVDEVSFDGERIPEPATLALIGAGLAGVGVARRRRSN